MRKYPVKGEPDHSMRNESHRFPHTNQWEEFLILNAHRGKVTLMGLDEFTPQDVIRLEYLDNDSNWEFDKFQPTGRLSPYTGRPLRNYIYKYIGPPASNPFI